MQTDVLVVGAGPTGLMLATELGLAGLAPVVIDALPTLNGRARAAAVQPRTAEVFDLRGLMDQLLERVLPGEPISGHFGGLPVALDCRPWNTRHLYPVPAPQGHVEQVLTQRLADYDVSVRRGHQLTALHADDDGVTATVHDEATGTDLDICAHYLVACDGGDSPVEADEVRHALQAVWGPDTELGEIAWSSRFSDATRQVEQYRVGRVLFAGDAAHIQRSAPAALLDSYHTERHPVAARVLHHTRAQRVLADRRPTDDVAALRDIVTDLARLPDTNRYLAGMTSGLDVRYPMPGGDHPLLGARMPDIDMVIDGVATRLSALMHTGRGLLLDLNGDDYLTGALDGHASCIDLRRATTTDIDVTAVLLWPDGHICWLGSAAQRRDPSLHAAIEQWFGGRSQPAKPGCQR